jgi:phosphoribosylamine---glycine ligase
LLLAACHPSPPRPGDVIRGLDRVEQGDDLQVLYAGARADGERVVTAGGRVLTVAALGRGVAEARARAYAAAALVSFDGMQLRRDVGAAEA